MVFAADYELHQRGSGISTIQMKAEDAERQPAQQWVLEKLGYPADTPYYEQDWEDPPDWDGEPMDYKLIINPTVEDEL
jgi:hypothetical protein